MRSFGLIILLLALTAGPALSQQRDWQVHVRGMLHQTVFNTGELGRPLNAGGTVPEGRPSLEWPPNSDLILNRRYYPGQHNSFGSGVWLAATGPQGRTYAFSGAVSNTDGDPVSVVGVYSTPLGIERTENYPLLADGSLNPAYDPDEAEEIITTSWDTPTGIRVKQKSRAWSYPGYDSFIIYEYEFTNITSDVLNDVFITFAGTYAPSMFGYQRVLGEWTEAAFRGQAPAGVGDTFARYDLKRWMSYAHDRTGLPDPEFFAEWSNSPGDKGGLDSPQAAGMMVLHYDYEHLADRSETDQVFLVPADSTYMWDENGKAKQPFLLRYENANLYDTKVSTWMDPRLRRKTGIWQSLQDSLNFAQQFEAPLWDYWRGRTSTSTNLSWWQPVARAYGFYPYTLPPGETLRFTTAEMVGYGAGNKGDFVYKDLGGNVRAGVDAGVLFNPVPSWFYRLEYPHLGTAGFMGNTYLEDNPLPWYVTAPVVSIRDVADRAIQTYTGEPLVKYDTSQYRPEYAPLSGEYSTIPIPIPAPALRIEDTRSAANRIIWEPQVESFYSMYKPRLGDRLRAPLDHYEVLRAPHPLGPWSVVANVMPGDPAYFQDGRYEVLDVESNLGDEVAYAVRTVDEQGNKSGWTNMSIHETQAPPTETLGKVYVVPNPVLVTSGLSGADRGGDIADRIQFMGLTSSCTIRIFSYTGQLVQTIEHERATYGDPWYQLSFNNQIVASGVYYFVVEDKQSGETSSGKFVVIH